MQLQRRGTAAGTGDGCVCAPRTSIKRVVSACVTRTWNVCSWWMASSSG